VEGLYKVEYDISGGTGRSVLYAHAGTMLGGNTAFAHFGTYENVDGEIIARLRTRATVYRRTEETWSVLTQSRSAFAASRRATSGTSRAPSLKTPVRYSARS